MGLARPNNGPYFVLSHAMATEDLRGAKNPRSSVSFRQCQQRI